MNSKIYKLPNGKTAVFEYDVCGIGKITLECMDELMDMIADRPQDVWCEDCKEYDKEHHNCPRFNHVIRTALEDAGMVRVVRCKECASYCGDGNKCLWGLLTADMGYCHHGYRGGDCITKQTEREGE